MRSVKWKWRETNAPFEVELDDQEWQWFAERRDRVVEMEPCEERTALLNEVCVFMELKDAFPGSGWARDDDSLAAPPTPVETAARLSPEARTEALAAMDRLESQGFRFPAVARQAVTDGQTSLLAEEASPAPSAPLRQPYKDAADDEPLRATDPTTEVRDEYDDPF